MLSSITGIIKALKNALMMGHIIQERSFILFKLTFKSLNIFTNCYTSMFCFLLFFIKIWILPKHLISNYSLISYFDKFWLDIDVIYDNSKSISH
jgi:hypothetical protein